MGVGLVVGGAATATALAAGTSLATAAAIGAAGLGLGAALSGGLGGRSSAAAAPATPAPSPPPAVAPVMDQTAINNATRQQAAIAASSSGRASTFLKQTQQGSGIPTALNDKLG